MPRCSRRGTVRWRAGGAWRAACLPAALAGSAPCSSKIRWLGGGTRVCLPPARVAAAACRSPTRSLWAPPLPAAGSYEEVAEGDFLEAVTKSDRVVCHFFHREFERCRIMDKHLGLLARKFFDTRFIKLSAPVSHSGQRGWQQRREQGCWSCEAGPGAASGRAVAGVPAARARLLSGGSVVPQLIAVPPLAPHAGRSFLCGEAAGAHAALRGHVPQRRGGRPHHRLRRAGGHRRLPHLAGAAAGHWLAGWGGGGSGQGGAL